MTLDALDTSVIGKLIDDPSLLTRIDAGAKQELLTMMQGMVHYDDGWPRAFVNRDTNRVYSPHSIAEHNFVYNDYPRRGLLRGGEGSGKSTAGIVKSLNRSRRRMPGLMCSPNLPHFSRSLWKEFQRWCPWDCVIPAHRRMGDLSWSPLRPFDLVFDNNTYIHMVGVKNAGSLEGPNLNWVHFDEARHYPDKTAITTLEGRIRIPGPNDEPPQLWYTTTPRMNWLFDYFGPVQCKCNDCGQDYKGEHGIEVQAGVEMVCAACGSANLDIQDDNYAFKLDSTVVRLTTKMNEPNLMEDFARVRGDPLTNAEKDVLLEGLWGQIEEGQPFLPSILWWDQCRDDVPPLDPYEPTIIALDAATGSEYSVSDCFAVLGVTRHWEFSRSEDSVAVRFLRTWQARVGEKIDFRGTPDDPGPERFLLHCCGYDLTGDGVIVPSGGGYNIIRVVFDPKELHDMATRLTRANIVGFKEFGQTIKRYEADRQLLNLITHRRVAHDGNSELRMHLMNSDRKLDPGGKRLRIAKRSRSSRIDLAVALSMAAHECLRLNI
jgi:hypothetical protein